MFTKKIPDGEQDAPTDNRNDDDWYWLLVPVIGAWFLSWLLGWLLGW